MVDLAKKCLMVRCTASPTGHVTSAATWVNSMASFLFPVGKVTYHFLHFAFFFFERLEKLQLCASLPTLLLTNHSDKSMAFLTTEVV